MRGRNIGVTELLLQLELTRMSAEPIGCKSMACGMRAKLLPNKACSLDGPRVAILELAQAERATFIPPNVSILVSLASQDLLHLWRDRHGPWAAFPLHLYTAFVDVGHGHIGNFADPHP